MLELSIEFLFTDVVKLLKALISDKKDKEKIVDTITLTLDAICVTKTHIQTNNGFHIKNDALADLYEEIISRLENLEVQNIPEHLRSKAKYWRNPSAYNSNEHLLGSVAKLEEIKNECINQLKKFIK